MSAHSMRITPPSRTSVTLPRSHVCSFRSGEMAASTARTAAAESERSQPGGFPARQPIEAECASDLAGGAGAPGQRCEVALECNHEGDGEQDRERAVEEDLPRHQRTR